MFFLKKLLQMLEENGFRAGRREDMPAERAAGARGRVVRREEKAEDAAAQTVRIFPQFRGRADGMRGQTEAGPALQRRGGEEEYAWYFAVRDFFARSAGACRTVPDAAETAARFPAEGRRILPAVAEFAEEEGGRDEFFAVLASLRGLNVEERRRGR